MAESSILQNCDECLQEGNVYEALQMIKAAASRYARAAAELFECPRPPGATVARWRLEPYSDARHQRRVALCGAGELDGACVHDSSCLLLCVL